MLSRVITSIILVLSVSACSYGEAEFQLYQKSFGVQHVEGAKVFDRLGRAERVLERRGIANAPGIPDFDPLLAAIYLDLGDPPLTASLRASLEALESYNNVLSNLATGASAKSLAAQLSAANAALDGTIASLMGITGQTATFATPLAGVIATAVPALELAIKARNRQEFRRQILAAYSDMEALLLELRNGTPVMFFVMREARKTPGLIDGVDGLTVAAREALEDDRKLLAGWVLLIDETLIAMESARDAVRAGRGSADLTGLVAATVEIEATAKAIKAAR